MPDELPVSPYPIPVETSQGTNVLLDPAGEPSGPRVLCPCGAVTALHAHGGVLAALTPSDLAALEAAIPPPAE